jgi:hypothetical protein
VRTAAFGAPVDPLVKVMMAGVSGPQGSMVVPDVAGVRPIVGAKGTRPPMVSFLGIPRIALDVNRDERVRSHATDAGFQPLASG